MTIASEIERLQEAKADIKTSIEGKGVSVPSSAKLDTYDTYIDQIETGVPQEDYDIALLFDPQNFILLNKYYNTYTSVAILAQLGDVISSDYGAYYCFFRLEDPDSTAYSKFRLCVRKKAPNADPIENNSGRVASARFYFRAVSRRMKRVGNDVKFSALYYERTSSASSAKDHYYCITYDSSTDTFVTNDCGIIDDIGRTAVYTNWTNNCGIAEGESIPAINKVNLSIQQSLSSNYYHLKATLNN